MIDLIKKIVAIIKNKKDVYGLWREVTLNDSLPWLLWGFFPVRILLLVIMILIEIMLLQFLSEFIRNVINVSLINNSFQIIIIILNFYIPYKSIRFYLFYRKKKKTNEDDRILNCLRYVISSLKLYDEEIVDVIVNDKARKERRIKNVIEIFYKEDDSKIYIRVIKDGGKYTQIANTLGENLQSAISYRLDSILDGIDWCDYIFKKKEDTRLILRNSTNIELNNSDEIYLTRQLSFRLSKQPHILIGGVTGGGKTTLINYLILELLKMQSNIYILDNKNSDLASLRTYLGSEYVGSTANESAKITRIVAEKMEQRFKIYKEDPNKFIYGGNYLDYKLKPIVLIVDELGALRASADKKVFTEIISNLTNIVLKGREMGVFVILSTQQPNSQNIPTELRDNLSVRISLGNLSDEGYRMVFGEVPEETVQNIGEGFVFIDGKGFSKPNKIKFPFVDYKQFDFISEIQKLINENERRY